MENQLPLSLEEATKLYDQYVSEKLIWPYVREPRSRRIAIQLIQQEGKPRCHFKEGGWVSACVCVITEKRRLTLEHKDKPDHWHLPVMTWLCSPHQLESYNLYRKGESRWVGASTCSVCVLESASVSSSSRPDVYDGSDAVKDLHESVKYVKGSIEMQANRRNELRYREKAVELLKVHGILPERQKGMIDMTFNLAEVVGCSTAAIERSYLPKLISAKGPLRQREHRDGTTWITVKNSAWKRWREEEPSIPEKPPYDESEFL